MVATRASEPSVWRQLTSGCGAPEIASAALASRYPLSVNSTPQGLRRRAANGADDQGYVIDANRDLAGGTSARGRSRCSKGGLLRGDTEHAAVAVVNEAFARRFWPKRARSEARRTRSRRVPSWSCRGVADHKFRTVAKARGP